VLFFFDVPEASYLTLTTAPDGELVVVYVRRADDAPACRVSPDLLCSDNAPIHLAHPEPLQPGRYYVVVDQMFEANDPGEFELTLRLEPWQPPLNDSCERVVDHLAALRAGGAALPDACREDPTRCGLLDPLLTDSEHALVSGTTVEAGRDHAIRPPGAEGACPEAPGLDTAAARDVVYAFTTEVSSDLDVSGGVTVLSLRGPDQCTGPEAELLCEHGRGMQIGELRPGTWFLIVDDGLAGPGQPFDLEVELVALPGSPTHDDCAPGSPWEPEPIVLADDGVDPGTATGQARGTLLGTHDDYEAQGCPQGAGGGPDVVYSIDPPYAQNEVAIDVTAIPDRTTGLEDDLLAYLRDGDPSCHEGSEIPGGCSDDVGAGGNPAILLTVERGQHLPAGRYFLFVDGYSEHDAARLFDVSVTVTETAGE